MPSLRAVAVAAAGIGSVALAAFILWPRAEQVAVWTAHDVDRAEPDRDEGAGELSAERHEIAAASGETTAPLDAEGGQPITLRGRVVDTHAGCIAGALVRIELRGADRERVRTGVTTGSDGTFAFRGPLRGARTVRVYAAHRDFAPAQVDRTVPLQELPEITLGDITMGHGASVRGMVVASGGAAVAAASVELRPESGSRARWSLTETDGLPAQLTDGAGRFTFTHLPPGAYRAVARATRMVAASSDSFALTEDAEVELPAITLQAGVLLVGMVTDRRGRGIDKAAVTVTHVGLPGPQQRAITAADGRFHLDHLRARLSDLRVSATGHVGQHVRIDLAAQSDITLALDDGLCLRGLVRDAKTGQPIEAFAVQPRRLRNLPVPVPPEHAGRSREELNRELAEASRQQGESANDPALLLRVASLQTALQALDGAQAYARAEEALSQDAGAIAPHPQGTFELTGLDAGVYAVDARADGYYGVRSQAVELDVGRDPPMLVIDLARGLTVRGQVVRQTDGRGIAAARVELVRALSDTPGKQRSRGPVIASAISADDGTFTLRNARPGRCAVQVTARGFQSPEGPPFELNADVDGLRVAMAALASLSGHVSGVPPGRESDVTVVAFAGFRNVVSRPVDAEARYRLDNLQPTTYHVRAYLANARAAVLRLNSELQQAPAPAPDVALAPGDDRSLDLALTEVALGAVRGTARINGVAASGYQVSLERTAQAAGLGTPTQEQQVEAGGGFAFAAVEPGLYQLRLLSIARERIELSRQSVQVLPGQDCTTTIDAGAAVCDIAIVAPEDGRSVGGFVRLLPRGADPEPEVSERPRDNRDLSFSVRGDRIRTELLPPGTYRAEVRADGERDLAHSEVELIARERKTLTLTAGALRKAPPGQPK